MNTLVCHVGRAILGNVLRVMAVLLVLFMIVEIIELAEEDRFGSGEVGVLILLSVPLMVYELFPMAALLGTTIGLTLLAHDSELVAMRATGISVLQITLSALGTGLWFVLAAMIVGELVMPYTERLAQQVRAEALHEDARQHRDQGLWIRDGETYVSIGEVLPDFTLRDVRLFTIGKDSLLRSMRVAEEAFFDVDHWKIRQVRETRIGTDDRVEAGFRESAMWETDITPEVLSVFMVRPEQLSFWQLRHYIRHLAANLQQTGEFELAFWGKLVLPLSTAIMVVLAIPFVFVSLREAGVGRNLFTGIMLGLGYYALDRGFGYIALANGLTPFLGAVLPAFGFLFLSMILIRRIP